MTEEKKEAWLNCLASGKVGLVRFADGFLVFLPQLVDEV